ncbi:MAG: hypothetical protein QGG71_18995, partial [Pirellulaceae bacterium]|nr:hypothetical protein [Pirellulaceae bacterium]
VNKSKTVYKSKKKLKKHFFSTFFDFFVKKSKNRFWVIFGSENGQKSIFECAANQVAGYRSRFSRHGVGYRIGFQPMRR